MQQISEREQWKDWEPEVDNSDLSLHLLKSQQYCVVQIAHAQAAIKSPDGNAWIRVIAFCSTLDNAYEIARNAHDSADKMETRILQSGKCALISRFKRTKGDFDKMLEDQKKANRMYDDYVKCRVQTIKNSKEHKAPELTETKPTEEIIKNEDTERFPCTSISMDFGKPSEVFMQRYFAIAIIQDTDEEYREPTVIPLCAAESMEELQELVKPLAKNADLIHLDIFCGTSLEWMPLYNPKSNKVFHKHPLRQALEEKIKWVHEP
jgi:hypothetical protein